MNKRRKEKILKAMIVAEGICVLLWVLLNFGGHILFSDNIIELLYNGLLIAIAAIGIVFTILFIAWGGIEQKPVMAEKFELQSGGFDELQRYFENSLNKKQYVHKKEVVGKSHETITMFARNRRIGWLECFSLINVREWTSNLEEAIEEELSTLVEQYCAEGKRYGKISMIIVICVDYMTPELLEIVNGNIQQGMNVFRLPIAISFDEKQIYAARQKDGMAIAQYKNLRKEFLDIMGIKE